MIQKELETRNNHIVDSKFKKTSMCIRHGCCEHSGPGLGVGVGVVGVGVGIVGVCVYGVGVGIDGVGVGTYMEWVQ